VTRQQQAHRAVPLNRPGDLIDRDHHRSLVHQDQLQVVLAARAEPPPGWVGHLAHADVRWPQLGAVELDPGDVVFFGGHVLHRSQANLSADRSRRSFVAHYCNARSLVPWDDEPLAPGETGNARHILARGRTHLPYAQPLFGTPCAAIGTAATR
jgi:Phytanoyl-CoA dioxygenase (PhyH)